MAAIGLKMHGHSLLKSEKFEEQLNKGMFTSALNKAVSPDGVFALEINNKWFSPVMVLILVAHQPSQRLFLFLE